MIEKIRKEYIENFKKKFFKINNMKAISEEIQSMGFTVSRVYGHKNVKRLTASDENKNRIEFIYSNKNKFIIFSLNFSNSLKSNIIIESEKENNIDFDLIFNPPSLDSYNIIYNNRSIEISRLRLFYNLHNLQDHSIKVKNVEVINKMFWIRKLIISNEIDFDKLPSISEISGKRKEAFVKNVSNDLVKYIYQIVGEINKQEIIFIDNRDYLFPICFYKYLINVYRFTDIELEFIFVNNIIPYIIENINTYQKKLLGDNEDNDSTFKERFNKDTLMDLTKHFSERKWFDEVQMELNSIEKETYEYI